MKKRESSQYHSKNNQFKNQRNSSYYSNYYISKGSNCANDYIK